MIENLAEANSMITSECALADAATLGLTGRSVNNEAAHDTEAGNYVDYTYYVDYTEEEYSFVKGADD